MKEEWNWSTVTVNFYLHWIAGLFYTYNDLFITISVHVTSIFYFNAYSCSQHFPNPWLLLVYMVLCWSNFSLSVLNLLLLLCIFLSFIFRTSRSVRSTAQFAVVIAPVYQYYFWSLFFQNNNYNCRTSSLTWNCALTVGGFLGAALPRGPGFLYR